MSARRFRPGRAAGFFAPLAATLVLAGASVPARAQIFGWFSDRPMVVEPAPSMPVSRIYRSLARRGYRLSGPLQRNGGVYLADVTDRRGTQERLVIDAYRGRVLQVFAYAPPRPPGFVPSAPSSGFAPSGPSYASREPFGFSSPPAGVSNSPAIHEVPRRAEEHSRRHSKTASRETVPHHESKPSERSPAEATAPPAHEPEPPASDAATDKTSPPSSVPVKAAVAPTEPAPAAAAKPAAAEAAPAKSGPAAKAVNKPGYANGVPINPLD